MIYECDHDGNLIFNAFSPANNSKTSKGDGESDNEEEETDRNTVSAIGHDYGGSGNKNAEGDTNDNDENGDEDEEDPDDPEAEDGSLMSKKSKAPQFCPDYYYGCRQEFWSADELIKHKGQAHGMAILCDKCDYKTIYKRYLFDHNMSRHPEVFGIGLHTVCWLLY